MARLYANENFPLPVVMELRRVGHDVLTVRVEFGAIGEAGGVDDEPEAFHALHGMMPDRPGIAVWLTRTSPVRRSESMHHWLFMPTCWDALCG